MIPRQRNRSIVAAGLCLLMALPAVTAVTAATAATAAAGADSSQRTLEQIMSEPDWIGNPPEDPYWSDDGRSIYYERQREGIGPQRKDLYRVDLSTGAAGKPVLVDPAQRSRADARGERNLQRTRKVYVLKGDVFAKDLRTGEVRQITRTDDVEADPHFLADGRRIWFHRGTDVFVYDLESGLLSQPAALKLDKDPLEKEPSILAEDQTRLFDVIRQKQDKEKRDREEDRTLEKADPTRTPLPWYLGKKVKIEITSLSPSGDWLAVVTAPKEEGDAKPAKLPMYVTESGNVETRDVRAKVGAEKPVPHSVMLLDLRKHERHDLDLSVLPGVKDDPLKALRESAKALLAARRKAAGQPEADKSKEPEKDKDKDKPPAARPLEVGGLAWSDDGRQLALELRARDNKDRWLALWDAAGGRLTPRHRLTDAAWINWDFNDFGWLPDNETLWFLSEESGYSQLYRLATRTGDIRRLTPEGRYEVSQPRRSWDGRYLYYTANHEHPGKYDVWRVEVATGRAEQLTRLGAALTHAVPSPDESQLLILDSWITRPDEVFVQANRPGAEARQVTHTRTPEFLAQEWNLPEILPIPSTHGAGPIYARIYTPKDFDPARKVPAAVFVHGAGYLQEVTYGWSNYFHEFMFNDFLTRHGYVVLDMDYRASAGYGRDWRTAIYRQMGHPELEDLQDGVAWLAQHKNVDPARVGVYGGSYGGFLTYMALFRQPDLFAAGAALRPVSDWEHYNEGYTADILNRPEVDPEAYEKSSPIEYAAGLQKPLLICDGMQDQNVFFQDNVRLVQRLIELKKENFEMAVYPVEDHGFVQPTSWLDEYRRIFKLFETNLK
ncbi:MAG TPA: prolyl oligopeptidase family serine peptidase [Thermoanaerobaculia bacterium]